MSLLEWIGQDAKSRLGTDRYKPGEGVERGAGERFFDWMYRQEDAIQEEGKKKRVGNLEESLTAAGLDPADIEFNADTTKGTLNKKVKDYKIADEQTTMALATGQTGGKTRTEIMGMSPTERSAFVQEALRKKRAVDDATNPETIRAVADRAEEKAYRRDRDKESDRRYLEQRIADREGRMLELDFRKQQQANEMKMFDKQLAADQRASHRERMAGIIAGLANLGAVFAI